MRPATILHRLAGTVGANDGVEPLDALRMARGGASATAIAEHQQVARTSVYRGLKPFCVAELLVDDREFRLTEAGAAVLRAFERATQEIDLDAVRVLAGSEYRPQLLGTLCAQPVHKAALATELTAASRPTVHRALERFEERDWVTPVGPRWAATEAGRVVQRRFERARVAIDQAIEKAAFLGRFPAGEGLPLAALAQAELLRPAPGDPHPVLDTGVAGLVERCETPTDLRLVLPACSVSRLFECRRLCRKATSVELLLTAGAFRELTRVWNHRWLTLNTREQVRVRVHGERLPWELWLTDETVLLAAAARTQGKAGVHGEASRLRRWAEKRFERLWERSRPPARRLLGWLDRPARTDC